MIKINIIIGFLLLLTSSYAQNQFKVDSLLKELNIANDTTQVSIYLELAKEYCSKNEPKCELYAKNGLAISREIEYKKGEALLLKYLASDYRMQGKYRKAVEVFSESIPILIEINDQKDLVFSYNNLGVLNYRLGFHEKALKYFKLALPIYEKFNDLKNIAEMNSNIGLVYIEIKEHDYSLTYLERSLIINKSIINNKQIATNYFNIAKVYGHKGNYKTKLIYLDSSMVMSKIIGDKSNMAKLYIEMGSIYESLNKYEKALKYYFNALNLSRSINNKLEIVISSYSMGRVYNLFGDFEKAIKYSNESLSYKISMGEFKQKNESYKNLKNAYALKGDYKSAYNYYKLSVAYGDSLFSKEKARKLIELQTKLETKKKEAENEKLKMQNDINSQNLVFKNILIGSIAIGLISSLILAIFLFNSRKKIKIISKNKLQKKEEQFHNLYLSARSGLFRTSVKDGKVLECNELLADLFGYDSREELIENFIAKEHYINPYERKNMIKILLADGEVHNYTTQLSKKDGTPIWVRYSAKLYKEGGYLEGGVIDVTDVIKAEKELKESEEKYKMLFEDNLTGVYRSNFEGKILECNNAFVKMYGYSTKEELLNLNAENIYGNENDRKYFINKLKKYKFLNNYEAMGKKKDGSSFWIIENVHIVSDNIIQGSMIDITDRKESEKKILQLSRGIEQSPLSVVITDVDGNIEYINPKVKEITGFSREELVGKNPSIFKSEKTPKKLYKELWDTILSGNIWQGELLNKRKNGEEYWENISIAPIFNKEGDIINYIAVKEDISENKKIMKELTYAKEKAEEMNKLKSTFLANMSHELRTPMVGIMGFIEILKEISKDSEVKEYAEFIQESGERLTETLNLILNLSKIESEHISIEKKPIDVIGVIKRIMNLYENNAIKKNLFLKLESEYAELYCETDPRMLDQIITNLVNNALKFTKEGGITIKINQNKKDYLLEIKIKDTGIGIPKEKQEIIWKEFRQVSEGDSRTFEGTGLGLSIAQGFAKRLDGSIELESTLGLGSIFTFLLPLNNIVDKIIQEKTPKIIPTVNKKLVTKEKPSLLYVEDDLASHKVVQKFLEGRCHVDLVDNGPGGIKMAKGKIYDLILMDINLKAKMSGVEVTQKLREFKQYKKTPIIALTAYAMNGEKALFFKKGFTDYLSKPFAKVDLINKVNNNLIKNQGKIIWS